MDTSIRVNPFEDSIGIVLRRESRSHLPSTFDGYAWHPFQCRMVSLVISSDARTSETSLS